MTARSSEVRAFLWVTVILATMSVANGASPVLAFTHGNDLLQNCQDRNSICAAYVTGVADTLEMIAPRLTNICRPEAVTIEQLVDVLISWLERHPAERHRPAAKLAGLAYADAWPCNK
jgi:hypothetical protein